MHDTMLTASLISSVMMMAPIKIGIIGYGFSTKCFHLPFILPNSDFKVHAFLQRAAPPTANAPAGRWGHCTIDFPQAKHYRTSDDFFADGEIDLVIVCTHTHEEFVEKALVSGKHVVVEKPFASTSAEAERLMALAKESGKLLTVFQNRRYDSDFLTVQKLVTEGALGDIVDAEIHFDVPSPTWIAGWTKKEYSPGEGMSFALGTHTIDQALCLFGRPASVTGFFRSNRGVDSDVDDTFTIILQYSGEQKNLLVTIKTAIVTHMKDQLKYFVRGTKGSFLKVNYTGNCFCYKERDTYFIIVHQFGTCPQENKAIAAPGKPATDPDYGLESEDIWGTLTTTAEFDGSSQKFDEGSQKYIGKYPSLRGWYRGYYENVAAAINGTGAVSVQPETARDGLKIIEMAKESHETGRTVAW
ncbi:hypothetical protein B0T17DRAFT_527968 [Bombardia bombarda]|uniref:Oxidoreductase n=1 Tax=Bombardia bombarda TaxID=252184 RepID=A0AA39XAA6_9PEZI|nr:hypothetical protein B0T17DRAFT_527968 [Bombardia bombarda]